jgi:molybdenum cofactor biosynthesis protein A
VNASTTTEEELAGRKLRPAAAAAASTVLTDRFGRHHNYLRISLAERCNLRCTYCMPPEGVPLQPQSQLLQTPEILSLARHFYNHGVSKIRLTGGEPTLRKDLIDVLAGLKAIGREDQSGRGGLEELAITTNGVTLAKNLDAYIEAGLNRVNISLDTLIPDKFAKLTRRPAAYFDRVWESLEAACAKAPSELVTKVNVVVMKGINDQEVADFCALQTRFPHLHIRFIEYMPFTENGWNMDGWVPYKDLLKQLEQQDKVQLAKLPEVDPNDTTKWYMTLKDSTRSGMKMNGSSTTAKGEGIGRIGFITSMSQPFCGTCNRLRLTSDGQIKVCLFDGNSTISLRDAIREGANAQDLDRLIQHALRKKHFSLGGHTSPEHILQDSDRNRPMTLIGG